MYPSAKLHAVQMLSTLGGSRYFLLLLVHSQGRNKTHPWVVCKLFNVYTQGIFNFLAGLDKLIQRQPSLTTLHLNLVPWLPHTRNSSHGGFLYVSPVWSSLLTNSFSMCSPPQGLLPRVLPQWFLLTTQAARPFFSLMTCSERPSRVAQLRVLSLPSSISLLSHSCFFFFTVHTMGEICFLLWTISCQPPHNRMSAPRGL